MINEKNGLIAEAALFRQYDETIVIWQQRLRAQAVNDRLSEGRDELEAKPAPTSQVLLAEQKPSRRFHFSRIHTKLIAVVTVFAVWLMFAVFYYADLSPQLVTQTTITGSSGIIVTQSDGRYSGKVTSSQLNSPLEPPITSGILAHSETENSHLFRGSSSDTQFHGHLNRTTLDEFFAGTDLLDSELEGTSWALKEVVVSKERTNLLGVEGMPFRINFGPRGQIIGTGFCSGYYGLYALAYSNKAIRILSLSLATDHTCGRYAAEKDRTFFEVIRMAQSYTLTESTLIIQTSNNVSLAFEPTSPISWFSELPTDFAD